MSSWRVREKTSEQIVENSIKIEILEAEKLTWTYTSSVFSISRSIFSNLIIQGESVFISATCWIKAHNVGKPSATHRCVTFLSPFETRVNVPRMERRGKPGHRPDVVQRSHNLNCRCQGCVCVLYRLTIMCSLNITGFPFWAANPHLLEG